MTRRIYIVEDNALMRITLVALFEEHLDLKICGVTETADAALDTILDVRPDRIPTDV